MKLLSDYRLNEDNPRTISSDKMEKLKKSISSLPQMMEVRPIVVDTEGIVLGGNMRYAALVSLGYTEVPDTWVQQLDDLTEDQKKEFIIKDNVGYGAWDWEILANQWDNKDLADWGLDVWLPDEEVDYSILDETDVSGEVSEMAGDVKKAIQIEFDLEHYDEAYSLIHESRKNGVNVGLVVLQAFKAL